MALIPSLDTTLTAADAETLDRFGAPAISGNRLVMAVGAWGWDGAFDAQGGVYIYDWNSSTELWDIRGSVLTSSTAKADDNFGYALDLNFDGSVIAVGVPGHHNDASFNGEGGVYVLDWDGSVWTQRSQIVQQDPLVDYYGFNGGGVALSGDATTLIISDSAFQRINSYDWNGSAWAQRAQLLYEPGGWVTGHNFGDDVSITDDGTVLVVGRSTDNDSGFNVFDLSGVTWVHRGAITENVTTNLGAGISITGDGLYIYAGEDGATPERVRKYKKSGSTWTEEGWLEPSDTPSGFGFRVAAISSIRVLVGATFTTSSAGSLYDVTELPVANGAANLFTASGTGVVESWVANGAATLLFGASGSGNVRTPVTAHLDQEYELSIGFIANTSHLDQEYELNAYQHKQAFLDQQYSIDVFKQITAHLDQSYALDAFVKHVGHLDQEYSINIFKQVTAYLDIAYEIDAFLLKQAFLDQEYSVDVFKNQRSYLDQEYSVDVFKKVVGHLDQQYSLFAFTKHISYLDQEYELDVYKIVQSWLDQEYSIDHFVKHTSHLDQEYSVDAYQKVISFLDQEYNLDAYAAVIAFLDICYELDANELFYTFATNLETGATSKYTNFNFNSLSGDIGASDTGLYSLSGGDGDGVAISSSVESGKIDFGSSTLKRMTDAYLGVTSDGNLKLTVTTETGAAEYTLTPSTDLETVKANLARGHKGKYWSIKIENVAGSTMNIDSIELLPQMLSRRR